ncbi:MAG: choice-of-anchor C family protein [Sphingomonadaceae bacterium]|nr:choice-of-anchor C family protein [Sphingomonadaceae bacterium]
MKKLLIALGALALAPFPAQAASFMNGSFEMGTNDPGAGFVALNTGDTSIAGWTVGGAGIDYIGGYWQAADGVRSIDLSQLDAGSVAQTFDTLIGQAYRVTFFLAGNPDGAPNAKTVLTMASGGASQTDTFTVGAGNTHANMGWTPFTYDFVANGLSTTLSFASQTGTPYGPALDNVSVLAVPEPAAWALLIAGFGFAGAALRRRRRETFVAA